MACRNAFIPGHRWASIRSTGWLIFCLSAGTSSAVAADTTSVRPPASEPAVVRSVLEDDIVRVEELRVRGEVQRIVVRLKSGGSSSYELLPGTAARDPSQGMAGTGQAAGRRVWNLLSF